MDVLARKVMAALVRRGHYPETPAGFAQAVVDAQDIVAAYQIGPTNACFVLRRQLHPPGRSDDACLRGDRDAMWKALHGEADQDAVWEALRDG